MIARATLVLAAAGCLLAWAAAGEGKAGAAPPKPGQKSPELCRLKDLAIRESSGVAASRRTPGVFWTHNDSGDSARLFAFDVRGRSLGTRTIETFALDWEDMAAVTLKGKHYLLVADTGDNWRIRRFGILHWLEEPQVAIHPGKDAKRGVKPPALVARSVAFSFPEGAQDCEAVAVDPADGKVYLATKSRTGKGACRVYSLPSPPDAPRNSFVGVAETRDAKGKEKAPKTLSPLRAASVGNVQVAQVTAMDISPDGRRMVLVNLRKAYQFTRAKGENWKAALARKPQEIVLPKRSQGESVCYGREGRFLYLTSECRKGEASCPLYRVKLREAKPQPKPKPKPKPKPVAAPGR